MELLVSPQGQKQNLHIPDHKSLSSESQKDLWLVVQELFADVDLAMV